MITRSMNLPWISKPFANTTTQKILLTLMFSILTGILAQIRIPLPFSPVPITGQTLAVILACPFLGAGYASLSQLLYVLIGLMGFPWFADATGGLQIASGATFGYLIGFIVAPLVMGQLQNLFSIQNKPGLLLNFFFGHLVIFIFGLSYLGLYLKNSSLPDLSFSQLLTMGLIPFLPGLIIKTGLAFVFTQSLIHRSNVSQ